MGGRLAQVWWVWVVHVSRTPNPEPQAGGLPGVGTGDHMEPGGSVSYLPGHRGAQREGGSVQIPQVEASLSPWP